MAVSGHCAGTDRNVFRCGSQHYIEPGWRHAGGSGTESVQYQPTEEEQQLAGFVSVVLADTEDAWNRVFERLGRRYQEPKLVLFSGSVESACGLGQAAMGPFYCPADQKAYIDLSFYRDLKLRHQAPGICPGLCHCS